MKWGTLERFMDDDDVNVGDAVGGLLAMDLLGVEEAPPG
jgi:hypothetical protein